MTEGMIKGVGQGSKKNAARLGWWWYLIDRFERGRWQDGETSADGVPEA